MNNQQSVHRLFWVKLTRDIFCYSFVFWLILFALEILKKGIVSNYLSLPHLGLLLAVLALIHLSIRPNQMVAEKPSSFLKPWVVKVIVSAIATLLILVTIHVSWSMTFLLIAVTVSSIWLVFNQLE